MDVLKYIIVSLFQKFHSAENEETLEDKTPLKKSSNNKVKKIKVKNEDLDSDSEQSLEVRTKKSAKNLGFALLAVSDGKDSCEEEREREGSDKDENISETNKTNKNVKISKKLRKKKKAEEDNEDIEKMLAELQMEYPGFVIEKGEPLLSNDTVEEMAEKKKKKKKKDKDVLQNKSDEINEEQETGTVKTAAQKKKEKKEREKLNKQEAKKKVRTTNLVNVFKVYI